MSAASLSLSQSHTNFFWCQPRTMQGKELGKYASSLSKYKLNADGLEAEMVVEEARLKVV